MTKSRLVAAWQCLRGCPVIFRFHGTITLNEAEVAIAVKDGPVQLIASHATVRAPAGTQLRADDGSLWVVPRGGRVHLHPDNNNWADET